MSKKNPCILQAVVFTDTFNDEFYPLTQDLPSTLIPLMDKPILSHTLEALQAGGVQEVFLFCKSGISAIQEFIRKAQEEKVLWSFLKIELIRSESCRTLGDCLRDLDGRGLIRGDFVLVEPGAIANIDLLPIFRKHKEITRNDKGACLTMICMKTGIEQNMECEADDCMYVTSPEGKLVYYKTYFNAADRKTSVPMDIILKYDRLSWHRGQRDIHISICSEKFLPLFSDNFDFETKEEFIKNLLMNEDVMDCSMYVHEISGVSYGGAIINWQNYQSISFELFDMSIKKSSSGYKEVNSKDSKLRSIVGPNTRIPSSAKVSRCIIGENVTIGKNVCLEDAIVFSNSKLGDNVKVRLSVIGSNCTIMNNCEILNNCVLGNNVQISEKTIVDKCLIQATPPEFCDEKDILGDHAYIASIERSDIPEMKTTEKVQQTLQELSEYVETDSEDDESSGQSPEEDTDLFLNEVVESLTRGLEDDVNCENLIFEINGSRYAYHIPLEEVNFFVIKGILKIFSQKTSEIKFLAKILSKFKMILKNYIRNEASMKDCLAAVEDQAVSSGEEDKDWVLFILKWFYQNDILSEDAILNWGKALHPEEKLYIKIHPFLKWLEEADEESSEDED
ncbi:translation initiation factor eIF-2B subunit epsilon [Coccinella septempunctata]|uniref:translation initiation factor eIF-2B subunit epsilon n=1 Tax=Coccinella septempunctata TaxID=41139 RepID=UPI001D091981|nr:translation initiation factor eIF-2B subunit epsilon [Coccinella septempunctata]